MNTTFPSNSGASQFENNAGDRATVAYVSGPIRVNVAHEGSLGVFLNSIRNIVAE